MALQLKQLPFIVLLLLSTISFSHASEQPCKCPCSDQDRRSNHTLDAAALALRMIDQESGLVPVDFDFIRRNLSDSEANSIGRFTIIDEGVELWQLRPDGVGVDEASFNVTIGYQPLSNQERQNRTPAEAYGGPTFLILPDEGTLDLDVAPYGANSSLAKLLVENDATNSITNRTTRAAIVSGSSVYVGTGVLANRSLTGFTDPIMVVHITIHEMAAFSPNYTMWIDYDRAGRRLSVYVDLQGKPKPENTIAEVHLNISSILSSCVYFSFVTMIGQLLPGGGLNYSATIEDLPRYDPDPDEGRFLSRKVTILSSVLGSIAVTAVLATAVACYFNSRYRRWHRDLDQLAKSMERLPGVPTKVEFADIKKATGNFHEAMKLGGGGFGTVYRCTLPAAASKTERPMDVAVKRFTRDVQNRRYDDFLAEVSIINRLRHKNIVPLIGWSYNKREPLLVFEFMTNGSLDQHLLPKGGNGSSSGGGSRSSTAHRRTGANIQQWATRYEIVRDVATGLHYVHHEYEPMVLHCDIKASNVMLDSSFRARLGDFGLACTVAVDRNSATVFGGTRGYIAPEYPMSNNKATRQTDIFAFGVLILEVVTGQRVVDGGVHITDRVWRLHREGRLLECVDAAVLASSCSDDDGERQLDAGGEAERMLLLGLACSNPNPSDRPTMPEVVQVIAKSVPPEVPLMKPRFVWPPPSEGTAWDGDDSAATSMTTSYLDGSMASTDERQSQSQVSLGKPADGGRASFQLEHSAVYITAASDLGSGETTNRT